MRLISFTAFGAVMLMFGCTGRTSVQCVSNSDCNLSSGGMCTLAPTGNRWCSYPDPECPGGYRFSDKSVGDDLSGTCVGQATGRALWASQLGSPGLDIGNGIAIDDDDNIISVGSFSQTIAPLGLSSSGGSDLYVVKLAGSTGNVIWAKQYGGPLNDAGIAVAVDSSKNIYVTGYFSGAVDFGSGPLQGGASGAGVVLMLDSDGAFQWAQRVDSRNVHAIATGGSAVVITGSYQGSFSTGTQTLTSVDGSSDIFVLKMSASNGAAAWAKSFGGGLLDGTTGIGIDSSSNIAITGHFAGTVNFGGGPMTAPGGGEAQDGFLLKLSPDGDYLLSKRFGGVSEDGGAALAIDSSNHIFIIGFFRETADFGCNKNLVASNPSQPDIMVAKYSQAGACLWASGFGGIGTNREGTSISVNRAGDVAASGIFCGSITFGGGVLTSASECNRGVDAFGIRLSGDDGAHRTSVRAGSAASLEAHGIVQSSDGRYFMAGRFGGFAEFGNQTLTSVGNDDAFVAGFDRL